SVARVSQAPSSVPPRDSTPRARQTPAPVVPQGVAQRVLHTHPAPVPQASASRASPAVVSQASLRPVDQRLEPGTQQTTARRALQTPDAAAPRGAAPGVSVSPPAGVRAAPKPNVPAPEGESAPRQVRHDHIGVDQGSPAKPVIQKGSLVPLALAAVVLLGVSWVGVRPFFIHPAVPPVAQASEEVAPAGGADEEVAASDGSAAGRADGAAVAQAGDAAEASGVGGVVGVGAGGAGPDGVGAGGVAAGGAGAGGIVARGAAAGEAGVVGAGAGGVGAGGVA